MTRVTRLIHNVGKYLLISIYPLPTHPTHNFTHKNCGNLDTLPGWPKKLDHNRPAWCAGQQQAPIRELFDIETNIWFGVCNTIFLYKDTQAPEKVDWFTSFKPQNIKEHQLLCVSVWVIYQDNLSLTYFVRVLGDLCFSQVIFTLGSDAVFVGLCTLFISTWSLVKFQP